MRGPCERVRDWAECFIMKHVDIAIVGGGVVGSAAAHNRYINMFHDKTFCPIPNRLTRASRRAGFTYFISMAKQWG